MFLVCNCQLNYLPLIMQSTKVDITGLKSVKNFAYKESVTTSYIYKLIKENKMNSVDIDGVKFIDILKYPTLPNKK
ncbi:MAG: hypothetical protein JWR54_1795 [Mucilaginibacter sp.]|nr:hypothetical protein [Mucilaginibacter sp.]